MNAHDPFDEPVSPDLGGGDVSSQDERFLALYNVAYPRIHAYVFSLLPNRTDARDALQETSLVLLRQFRDSQFRPTGAATETEAFIRWGCGIALNQVRRVRRQHARMLQFSDQTLERITAAREQYSGLLELRRRFLPECINRLSEPDRDLVARCFSPAVSVKAVAQQLDRSVNTLYKALNRIRATLKECIDRAVRREERA